MIDCVTIETAHLFGDALASQFRLRHKVFVERENYNVPTWRGMEYDQYDTPATVYCIARDDAGVARGVARLAPTDRPYMIKDLWPDMVYTMPLPGGSGIWEATRLGIDQDLPKEQRSGILNELILAYMEAALMLKVEYMLGVMPLWAWEHCFLRKGWPVQFIGPSKQVDGDGIWAARLDVSEDILENIRSLTGIESSVLRTADHVLRAREAEGKQSRSEAA